MLAQGATGWLQTASSSTNSDYSLTYGSTGVSTMYYVLWGGNPSSQSPSAATFLALANVVVNGCLAPISPPTIQLSSASGLQYTSCGAARSAGVGDIQYSTCYQGGCE
jgi:hypothetical protein